VILDTEALVSLMQGDERTMRAVDELEDAGELLAISSVTLFELHHSLSRIRHPERRRREIDTILESRESYPADDTVMKKAGRIDGRLAAAGEEIGMGDTIIGATALVHEQPVLTRNAEHFSRIDGLEVESH
jgi:tRNA(fMet)-specific endonuclease VapC